MRFTLFLGFLMVVATALWSTSQAGSGIAPSSQKTRIVTTTAHIADVVQNIGGEYVDVEALMGPGTDPHLYRPTRLDILKLNEADMVFYNGLHLEGQMVGLLETLGRKKPSIAVAANIKHVLHDEDGAHDPHIWMDVQNWIAVSDVVLSTLEKALPDKHAVLRENAQRYKAELAALERSVRNSFASVPKEKRILITAHDAFGYLGDAYGVDVIGIQGLSTASEAGLRQINALVDRIVEDKIPAIFIETSVSDQNIRALIAGARARGHEVEIGGALYSDALGSPGTYAGTYIGMMEHNTRTIVEALGGKAPALSRKTAELR